MTNKIYLVCGIPGVGKSWVCRQLKDKFNYIEHDRCWIHPYEKPSNDLDVEWPKGAQSTHLQTLLKTANGPETKPIITECPFAERKLKDDLTAMRMEVIPIFVIETPEITKERYEKRTGREFPKANLTRCHSIVTRAIEWKAFLGTSEEVLNYLREI